MNSIFLYRKKRFLRLLIITFTFIGLSAGTEFYINSVKSRIPDDIYITEHSETTIDLNLPVTAHGISEDYNEIIDLSQPVTFKGNNIGTYDFSIKLFGLFDISRFKVNVVDEKNVYPCGFPIGMYMKTDGVLVVDIGEFQSFDESIVSPCENVLKKGDYITAVNGEDIYSKSELNEVINRAKGSKLVLNVRRDCKNIELGVVPVRTPYGDYKIGVWVKDDAQGIGTMTYITDEGEYGALGHGVSEQNVSKIIEINGGAIYKTKIVSVVKGNSGKPGEFVGTINYNESNRIGTLDSNTGKGIFGKVSFDFIKEYNLERMPVGYSQDVKKGNAVIRVFLDGECKDYDIKIEKITNGDSKNITYCVVSDELLNKTNGIVQGMSGSPIIQNGKIVGAVTHVLVNDPTRGYGIFIENMLKH